MPQMLHIGHLTRELGYKRDAGGFTYLLADPAALTMIVSDLDAHFGRAPGDALYGYLARALSPARGLVLHLGFMTRDGLDRRLWHDWLYKSAEARSRGERGPQWVLNQWIVYGDVKRQFWTTETLENYMVGGLLLQFDADGKLEVSSHT